MAGKATQDRIYRFGIDPETGVLDRQGAVDRLTDLEASLNAIGGMFTMAAVRQPVLESPGEWETVAYVVRWSSFVPGIDGEPEPQPGDGDEMLGAPAPPAPLAAHEAEAPAT